MEMAFEEVDYTIGGKRIEWIRESSDAQADVALARARKLIEQDDVDIIIGPLSGAEGIALRDYFAHAWKARPSSTASSGAADTTLRDASPNFFRFNTEGTQWMAGLGTYVYDELGGRTRRARGGRLCVPLCAGRRLHAGILRGRRRGDQAVVAAQHDRFRLDHRQHSR